MNGWQKVELGELVTYKKGFAFKSATYSSDGDVLIVRVSDTTSDSVDIKSCMKIPSILTTGLDEYKLQTNDVIIATVGSWADNPNSVVGKVIKVPSGANGALLNQNAVRLRCNEQVFQDYFYYNLKDYEFSGYLLGNAQGSANQASITLKDIFAYKLNLPCLPEQKAIASVLSSLDDKIDLLHRQNTTLERMAETLFRQWFVVEAQEDWEVKPLKDVCNINNGYAFQSGTYKESGQKIIRTMNFNNHWIDLNSLVYISHELATTFEKFYLQRNDFLLVMVGASLGNFAIVTDDVLPSLQNQNMWCFRTHQNSYQHYLNFALRNIINDALNGASGSAREFFQKGVFYEIKIQTPPNELVMKFHDISESYFSKIELNRKQIQTLEKLRDTLLPKLMRGEVRVLHD